MAAPPVLLDTNLLILAVAGKLNLSHQLALALPGAKPVVPSGVLAELRRMDHPLAPAALDLAATFTQYPTTEESVDELLVGLAGSGKGIVATNDKQLIEQLKHQKLPVLRLKGNNRLVLEGRRR